MAMGKALGLSEIRNPRQGRHRTKRAAMEYAACRASRHWRGIEALEHRILLSFTTGQVVEATTALNVRASPSTSASVLTTEATGAEGSVYAGPYTDSTYTWWGVIWNNGYMGWSVGTGLAAAPTISVTSPTANSTLQTGNSYTINWSVSGYTNNIYGYLVELSTNGGANYSTIGGTVGASSQSLPFTPTSGQVSSSAVIWIKAIDSGSNVIAGGFTNGTFKITIPPPAVATLAATSVTSSSAQLNASYDSQGLLGTIQFQYGTTSSYGSATLAGDIDNTTTATTYVDVSGLAASTTYHYRVVATTSAGTSYGNDMTFTTMAPANQAPNTPANSAPVNNATGVSLTPTLTASAFSDPNAGDTQAAAEWIVTRVSDGVEMFDTGTDTVDLTSWTIPAGPFANSTAYSWKVRYEDNHGAWSNYSTPTSFTTLTQPTHLVIIPTWDSSISGDSNEANIEAAINQVISQYESLFSNPITVNITFAETHKQGVVGETSFQPFAVPYAIFRAKLAGSATSTADEIALANLPDTQGNPVPGATDMILKPALIKALGITGIVLPPSDATISLNTGITDVGNPAGGTYSLLAAVQHEIDEALGLGSTLGLNLAAPLNGTETSPEDLYRYDSDGNRSFTTSGDDAFFSIDGKTDLVQFNQNQNGDYGDWWSLGGQTPRVQDAFADPLPDSPTLGIELTALDVIGYTLAASQSPPAILGEYLFYQNSPAFDGGDDGQALDDEQAIAGDKSPLLPGRPASFANYTSYSRGINGLMIDVAGPTSIFVASDFIFRAGNDNNPTGWSQAPSPSSISILPGAGLSGSTRVEITWPDNAIQNEWLQVTVLADSDTGLASPDIFYFGNAIGETGNDPTSARVDAIDEIATRADATSDGAITNPYDFNRDGVVDSQDEAIARNNQTNFANQLNLIQPPAVNEDLTPGLAIASAAQSMTPTATASGAVPISPVDNSTLDAPSLLNLLGSSRDRPQNRDATVRERFSLSPISEAAEILMLPGLTPTVALVPAAPLDPTEPILPSENPMPHLIGPVNDPIVSRVLDALPVRWESPIPQPVQPPRVIPNSLSDPNLDSTLAPVQAADVEELLAPRRLDHLII